MTGESMLVMFQHEIKLTTFPTKTLLISLTVYSPAILYKMVIMVFDGEFDAYVCASHWEILWVVVHTRRRQQVCLTWNVWLWHGGCSGFHEWIRTHSLPYFFSGLSWNGWLFYLYQTMKQTWSLNHNNWRKMSALEKNQKWWKKESMISNKNHLHFLMWI